MEVFGYKCFNKDLTNIYGNKFEIGKKHKVEGKIKFGTKGNGFHFCKNIEDTFRYFNTTDGICVCEVSGSGEIITVNDEYNEYFDMYCAGELTIIRKLDRTEIIKKGLMLSPAKAIRFISTFKLSEEEIELFKIKFQNDVSILRAIDYYQENDMEVYKRAFSKTR